MLRPHIFLMVFLVFSLLSLPGCFKTLGEQAAEQNKRDLLNQIELIKTQQLQAQQHLSQKEELRRQTEALQRELLMNQFQQFLGNIQYETFKNSLILNAGRQYEQLKGGSSAPSPTPRNFPQLE